MPESEKLSILVAEDDEMTLDLLTKALDLRYPDAVIYSTNNGESGLDYYRKHRPDVVITDINMPGMNGIAMAREILSIKDDARIIAVTAYGDRTIQQGSAEAGIVIHHYLLKPLDYFQLFAAVDDIFLDCGKGEIGEFSA